MSRTLDRSWQTRSGELNLLYRWEAHAYRSSAATVVVSAAGGPPTPIARPTPALPAAPRCRAASTGADRPDSPAESPPRSRRGGKAASSCLRGPAVRIATVGQGTAAEANCDCPAPSGRCLLLADLLAARGGTPGSILPREVPATANCSPRSGLAGIGYPLLAARPRPNLEGCQPVGIGECRTRRKFPGY